MNKTIFKKIYIINFALLVFITIAGCCLSYVLKEADGSFSFFLGSVISFVFSLITVIVFLFADKITPIVFLAVFMGVWLIKIAVLMVVLYFVKQIDGIVDYLFFIAICISIAISVITDAIAVVKSKISF